jgi:hypothetical protein
VSRHEGTVNGTDTRRSQAFAEKRRRYAELREDGMNSWSAAQEIGVDPDSGGRRYERWYLAETACEACGGTGRRLRT